MFFGYFRYVKVGLCSFLTCCSSLKRLHLEKHISASLTYSRITESGEDEKEDNNLRIGSRCHLNVTMFTASSRTLWCCHGGVAPSNLKTNQRTNDLFRLDQLNSGFQFVLSPVWDDSTTQSLISKNYRTNDFSAEIYLILISKPRREMRLKRRVQKQICIEK